MLVCLTDKGREEANLVRMDRTIRTYVLNTINTFGPISMFEIVRQIKIIHPEYKFTDPKVFVSYVAILLTEDFLEIKES